MRNWLVAVLLLLGTACSSAGSPYQDPNRPVDQVEIEVVNLNFNQATLWAIGPMGRRRLGIVNGKGTQTFTLEWRMSGLLQIETQILSGGRCFTEQLETDPGDLLYLEVPIEPRNDPTCR